MPFVMTRRKVTHLATKPIHGNMHPNPSLTDCPRRIADDGSLGGVDQGGEVHLREVPIHQLQLVHPQQCGHNGLDLHVGKRLSDAPVPPCPKGNVGEFLTVGHVIVQKPG